MAFTPASCDGICKGCSFYYEKAKYCGWKDKPISELRIHAFSGWHRCSCKMPAEMKYEEDTIQGHREWTESEKLLVCTSDGRYYVDNTRNGIWLSLQNKGIGGGEDVDIIAWKPIPKFKTHEEE